MRTLVKTILLSGALALAGFPAIIGVGTTGGTPSVSPPNSTIGFAFSVNSPVDLLALGYWDQGENGLLTAHEVGVWDSIGTLIASVTVPSGMAGTLNGGYRFVNLVAPVALGVGNYVIGGFTYNGPPDGPSDRHLVEPTLAVAPQLTFQEDRSIIGSGFALPNTTSAALTSAYFGPNLIIEPIQVGGDVPEPSTAVMALAGVALVALGLRRRKEEEEKRAA